MSGGSLGNQSGNAMNSAMQNYPLVPNSEGGAQAYAAGANPQAQSLSQLQQALQKLGARGPQGQQSPAMQVSGIGQQMMQQGAQQPRPQMPMNRPVGGSMPMQGAMPPQMANGGMGMGQGGMNIQQLNQLLGQRTGLMG